MGNGVAVVTGASRGLGRGIARALGSRGLTVYATGRNDDELQRVAEEVTTAGGRGVAARCDHRSDEKVKALFDRVRADSGHLDILVNNAAAVYPRDLSGPGAFWQKPLHLVDMIDVGLRSNYVAAHYAAPLMVETRGGLMAHILARNWGFATASRTRTANSRGATQSCWASPRVASSCRKLPCESAGSPGEIDRGQR